MYSSPATRHTGGAHEPSPHQTNKNHCDVYASEINLSRTNRWSRPRSRTSRSLARPPSPSTSRRRLSTSRRRPSTSRWRPSSPRRCPSAPCSRPTIRCSRRPCCCPSSRPAADTAPDARGHHHWSRPRPPRNPRGDSSGPTMGRHTRRSAQIMRLPLRVLCTFVNATGVAIPQCRFATAITPESTPTEHLPADDTFVSRRSEIVSTHQTEPDTAISRQCMGIAVRPQTRTDPGRPPAPAAIHPCIITARRYAHAQRRPAVASRPRAHPRARRTPPTTHPAARVSCPPCKVQPSDS